MHDPSDEPADDLARLVFRLQSEGLRVDVTHGDAASAGPDRPTSGCCGSTTSRSRSAHPRPTPSHPLELRPIDDGLAIFDGDRRLASARTEARPRFYDLATDDGIPYWKIALLHLDSLASTVLQTCAYWGNDDQCTFCGIGVSLDAGRTIAKKRPEQLAEVAVAARELDGAVDATLTTGSTAAPDKGALYVGRCAQAVKEAVRAAGRGAVRAARRPRRHRPGARPGRRLGRHPRRVLRPRACWPASRRPRPARASTATSGRGSGPSRRSATVRSRPT